MSKKKAKTEGLEWLGHSLTSFNGSGYADKTSAEAYLVSYIEYKSWKKDHKALDLVNKHQIEALSISEHMLNAKDAGHIPSKRNLKKLEQFLIKQRKSAQNVELML